MNTRNFACLALVGLLLTLFSGCRRKAYDNPIATNSQQPDKILFDKAINAMERRRYELTRLTLNTLINTYPDSEYVAKAKLAIADSWYREGTTHALVQAEAEYKDFRTFFPMMEESAESQMNICRIHYDQMRSSDRDQSHALKADHECRQMLLQYPNSRHSEPTRQMLREVQEVIADAEFLVGSYYTFKGSYRAGAGRLQAVTDHYPLYSRGAEALWILAQAYEKLGERYVEATATAYEKLVSDYPLSKYVDEAKSKLVAANRPVPEPDPARFELTKYNLEHETQKGMFGKIFSFMGTGPNFRPAAKMGEPVMTALTPPTPMGIGETVVILKPSAGLSVGTISGESKLDTEPDARKGISGSGSAKPDSEQPDN